MFLLGTLAFDSIKLNDQFCAFFGTMYCYQFMLSISDSGIFFSIEKKD